MSKPHPIELRERVLKARKELGETQESAAKRFMVGVATVARWEKRYQETGSVERDSMGGAHRQRIVDEKGEPLIREALDGIPDCTHPDLCGMYLEMTGVRVSPQTMSDTVRRLGYTRKKGVFRGQAAFRPEVVEEREEFAKHQAELDSSGLVFLDEAGVDIAMSRTHGWAPRGETPAIERPARGRRISLIGAIAADGPRALRKVEGYVDGEEFIAFLKEDLGPKLNKGDIVVMDGPSIHKVEGVAEVLAERGAIAMILPPYSPEFNPIEMTWSWLKNLLRAAPPRKLNLLREQVEHYWATISTELCQGWVGHCGYVQSS